MVPTRQPEITGDTPPVWLWLTESSAIRIKSYFRSVRQKAAQFGETGDRIAAIEVVRFALLQ